MGGYKHTASAAIGWRLNKLFLIFLFSVCDDVNQIPVVQVSSGVRRKRGKHLLHLRVRKQSLSLYPWQPDTITVTCIPHLLCWKSIRLCGQHLCNTAHRNTQRAFTRLFVSCGFWSEVHLKSYYSFFRIPFPSGSNTLKAFRMVSSGSAPVM